MSRFGRKTFKPVTPRNAAEIIAPRVGEYRVLRIDRDSWSALPDPYGGPGFYYTRSDWSEGVSWAEFRVQGATFKRRVRHVQVGNSGCRWVRILGTDYQIHEEL